MNKLEQIVTNADPEARKILEEFVHTFAGAIKEINTLKQKIDYIAHDNRLLRKRLFGSSSEKLTLEEPTTQDELYLFNELPRKNKKYRRNQLFRYRQQKRNCTSIS